MSYISLYRKYRPQNFGEIIGQKYIVTTLQNAIKLNKLTHAYIFAGPKGIGKTTIAKIFAKALNCLHPINGNACNRCVNCIAINQNQTTDILELDAASNNGVDDIRNIIEEVKFVPAVLTKKVYIIDEAHMLTVPAWNAMLKTIEDAPNHVVFIFATTEIYKIPPTILSRCQHYQFSRLLDAELINMINEIAKLENIIIDANATNKIAELADGSARDALSILEQLALYSDNHVTTPKINEVFGLIDDQHKITLLNDINLQKTQDIVQTINDYAIRGVNFSQLVNELIIILLDKLVYLQTKDLSLLKKLNVNNVDSIQLNQKQVIDLITVWQQAYMKIRTSADPKFYFEAAIFSAFKVQQQTAIQPITNTTTPIIDSSVSLKEDTKIKLAPIDSVFSYHEHPVETKTNHLQTKTENKIPLTIEDIFIGIAANNNAESKQKAQEFLASVKTELHPGVLSFLIPAAKIIVASKHGFVLVYDDELDAQFLNDKYNNFDFLNKVRKYFGKPMYIIGVSRHQLLSLADKFKNLRNQGRSFLEPPIDDLEEILKRNSSITQTAYEIYNN